MADIPLKSLFCILLVFLHLLNLVGGYWFFYAFQQQSKQQLAQDLDLDSYAGSQAILIKLPLSQPASDDENYERVDGEFEYEGTVYRLVKQKFYRDTAYVVCYKDEKTIAMKSALEDYVKTFTDNTSEKKSDNHNTSVVFIKDYVHHGKTPFVVRRVATDVVRSTGYLNYYSHLLEFTVHHPPEMIG
ncbi:MAG TPA: hypothetical protein VK658_25240 [Chryseolinea sp.]|nr:hypothetical protein [Chryseolinea sp.]